MKSECRLSNTSYPQHLSLIEKRHDLKQQGFVLIENEDIPFSQQDWEDIERELERFDYQTTTRGETGEATGGVRYFRIKVSYLPDIYSLKIWSLLNKPEMKLLYDQIMELNEPFIDRCQVHEFSQDGFLGKHIDVQGHQDYDYTAIIYLNDDYEGGEFYIYNNEENPALLKPPKHSLIITSCHIAHEVKVVREGKRKTLCSFFSDGKCYPKEGDIFDADAAY